MIIYAEKGIGLHDAIAAAGHWLAEVNGVWQSDDDAAVQAIIDAYVPVPAIPPPISARQIRLALNQLGLRDAVEAAVIAGSRDLRDWWEYSIEVHRDNPMVVGMIQTLGVSPEQADALWVLGATL